MGDLFYPKEKRNTRFEIDPDMTHVRKVVESLIQELTAPDAPKSRYRSLVVTKLEEAYLWAGEGQRLK